MPDETIIAPGALPDPIDERDFEAPLGAGVSVDFNIPFQLPEPPNFNQSSADCCVACAWSYFHWQVGGTIYSKRDLFCRIAQDYGAYIRDGGLELVKNGQADNKEVKDPSSPNMTNMRSSTGTKPEYRIDGKVYSSFTLPQQDIEGYAWAIKNYKGIVFGVYGTNEGWKDKENPIPPSMGVTPWGHALYGFGYHMHAGEKCIIAKSSWGGTVHHIKHTYFYTGNTFSAWTLIPKKETPMYITKKVKVVLPGGNVAFGAAVLTPNMLNVTLAEDEAEWRSYSDPKGYGLASVNPDATTNWDVDETINLA